VASIVICVMGWGLPFNFTSLSRAAYLACMACDEPLNDITAENIQCLPCNRRM
jgi:hypothetical protein